MGVMISGRSALVSLGFDTPGFGADITAMQPILKHPPSAPAFEHDFGDNNDYSTQNTGNP